MGDKPVSTSLSALIENKAGAYKILPGGAAFCAGIIPYEGYEVVRVLLRSWIPLEQGYTFIESYLKSVGRPVQAFCGIELRVPAPLAFKDWSSFNVPYLEQLHKWGLIFGDYSGVCRSNIALALHPPATTSLCAFTYTAPTSGKVKTFFLSGQADIDASGKIISEGDIGPAAMQMRARYTIDTVGATLAKLGVSWQDTTQIAFFHAHDIPDLWGAELLGSLGEALRRGVLVYRARPPIAGLEVELEARAVRQEIVVANA
jgi:enamine deaminase RidA (YjgF/YER057c/UK114 family)